MNVSEYETMDGWAEIATEEGETSYANPAAGKCLSGVGSVSGGNWEEYSSRMTCVQRKHTKPKKTKARLKQMTH